MRCLEVFERVTEHREGTLTVTERHSYEEHVAGCEDCRAYVESIEVTVRSLDALPHEPADPQVRRQLVALFRDRRAG